ncbi:neuraminidase-like domain-containing protein [Pelagibius sp. Alg239-R121]|uniref:Tc toxin subunit A-related protein n=1 Tax=Pelagibius sp. Alg239-R121 TaxID=2993448 RepID=UPI0024A795F2|nr:neuraminidase-like domain-containing protein [Pelagibius sp. Alg239-R121]
MFEVESVTSTGGRGKHNSFRPTTGRESKSATATIVRGVASLSSRNTPAASLSGTTYKAARLVGFKKDVASQIAVKAPDISQLDSEATRQLVDEGTLDAVDAGRLAIASVVVEMTGGDESAAGKVLTALENRGVTKPQDLAGVNSEEMTDTLESAGVGSREEAAVQAANLRTAVSTAFPSEILSPSRAPLPAATVRRGKQRVSVKPETIDKAWKNNADLDLLRLDISKDSSDRQKLNLSGLGAAERKAFIRDIQVRKGAVRATQNADIAEKLLNKGITSPGTVSPARLAKETGISLARAVNTHKRDIQHFGRLSHGLFTLLDAHSGGLQDTAVGNLRQAKVVNFVRRTETNETFDGLDNIEELFGDQDSCDCKHCNSILGPTAYFVDLMHFLHTHVLDDDVAEGDAPFQGKQNHQLHLKTRRPDLWVLPLTCKNTHTEVPQLQITNEIFENFLAEKRGTIVTPDRKDVLDTVYGSVLPGGRNSMLQPFHLPMEELEIYLTHFKLRRNDIAELLDEPEDDQLRAVLGISKVHASLITIPDAAAVNVHNKLGLSIPADGILSVKKLLHATQLPRQELGELLQSRFVGGAQPMAITAEKKSAESVQFDIERVHDITHGHLDRIHRFLRLKRFLSWLPKELDGFIDSAGGNLDSATLADAGRAAFLKGRFKASPYELCAFAGDLPQFSIERKKNPGDEERTPFDMLFNVPDLMREDGSYPNASIRYSEGETSSAAQERSMRLRAGLRIDKSDLAALIEGLADAFEEGAEPNVTSAHMHFFGLRLRTSPRPTLPTIVPPKIARPLAVIGDSVGSFPLDGHNLSLLFRHAVLARWLKLSIVDLLTLIRLAPDVGNYVKNLRDVLAVVRFYDWWRSTRLSLQDLSLLLAPVDALQEQVEDLWEALQAWLLEQDQVLLTSNFLTQIEGVSEELSREIVAFNTGKIFELDGDLLRVAASSDVKDLDLTPAEEQEVDVEAIKQHVRGYLSDERLPRALTEALGMDIELARAVVAAALAGDDDPSPSAFLKGGALQETLRPALVAILRLHRVGLAARLVPLTLTFFAENQGAFGVNNWIEPNPKALRRIVATQTLLKKNFRDDPAPALAQIKRVLERKEVLIEVAVAIFGIESSTACDLVRTLRIPENVIDALLRIERYSETIDKLSIDATALSGIVDEDYVRAGMASTAVVAGFRAKYAEEAAFYEKVEPFQERVLEKKRDALIDYLLRGPDAEFPDAREMYKYFLIDGEVDGCFRTSRVVAANSSLQLYVHRIRMNLEKEPNGGLHVPPSLIPDEEWEWRQHYRVWEANRKIFLWPENYLDPTIRDDKTPLFEELESELLQQEITEQTVVDAYSNYLKGLEELANLRYAGAYHHYIEDEDSAEVTDIIYLFGATGGEAPTHYWREIRNLARSQEDELVSPEYGPWRKVETRISTRHVSPIVYDGQLHVFWNEITTTSQNAVNDGKSRFIGYAHRFALQFSSLLLGGQWTPPGSISLTGAAPTFEESNSSVDDPLAEKSEIGDFYEAIFAKFFPWFGIYRDSNIDLDEAKRNILVPRWGIDIHTKAREGYTVGNFMWERPYLSADPSYGHRLLVNCAGLMVRGAVDLFDRLVLRTDDTLHKTSPVVESQLLAYRRNLISWAGIWSGGLRLVGGLPDFTLLRRDNNSLSQETWSACPFDYTVAATLALNARNLEVFKRHWGGEPGWSSTDNKVANVTADAGVWAVAGTPGETVIETEDELFLLQPSAIVADHYVLHRLGTTLIRDVARKLFTDGVDGLLATAHQLGLSEQNPEVTGPRTHDQTIRNPIANDASYGIYYQEIFQHIPLLIAHHLNAQGKFEHAQRWYHYVFDPTSPEPPTDTDAPETDRNWKYRQFRGQEQTKLRDVLSDTAAIQKYREDPFNAHAIARLRVSAYQKAVVMRYIDNLLDWADVRFRHFQMETVNEAMMLYVTAAEVLGPRPVQLGDCGELSDSARTYDNLKESINKNGELLLEVEELIPRPTPAVPAPVGPAPVGPALIKPVFGLKGLLAFPLSKATIAVNSTGPSVTVGGKSAVAVAMETPIASMTETDPIGAKTGVAKPASTSTSMAIGATSLPMMMTIAKLDAGKGAEQPGAGRITAAMKGANAAKASKGKTGFLIAEEAFGKAGTVESSDPPDTSGTLTQGIGKATNLGTATAVGGLLTGAVPFVKAALAQPRTEALVKSFALRQQYQFLGGRWKINGGHRIPSTLGDRFGRAVVRQISAAFCIPRNEVLEDYWFRVEDRIQKIRSCRDITGRKRKLSLFAPPIDPNLLARARAAGIALDDALGAFEGTVPQYRFPHLLQKAKEFNGTVRSFGAELQSALERKDVGELVRLQTTQQQQILALTTKAKEWELESARANVDVTERRKTAIENRQAHYSDLLEAGLNKWEHMDRISTHVSSTILGSAATLNMISAVLGMAPQIGSPFAMKYGGVELKEGPGRVAQALAYLADLAQIVATSARLEGGTKRRKEDWQFQRDQSKDEASQIEKQIEVAEIARDLAEHAIKFHEKNIEHNEELLDYHEDKFSSLGLYTWLASQLQRTYGEAYNMAYRMARYAEQAYRFEREDYTSELLSGQYWEAPRAGFLAGNRMTLDLQHLEQRYIETDHPKRELTDHFFSLRQWDPMALVELRQKGECTFKVPELFFDLASPGDYRRRLRSVRVTIPAVAGPYINVMASLSLYGSQMRYEPSLDLQDAPRPRVDSITTSSARNDAGAFELNFRGEKYMPYEGAGAVSEWSLSLPTTVRMFDYRTIGDVVLHLDYTASFDGLHRDVVQGVTTGIVASAQERLASDGMVRAFNLKEEFPAEYQRLVAGEMAEIEITADHLPFFLRLASVSEATLVFTSIPEDEPTISEVELDGSSLGAPTADEEVDGLSVELPIRGEAPWKHLIRVQGLLGGTGCYLVFALSNA